MKNRLKIDDCVARQTKRRGKIAAPFNADISLDQLRELNAKINA